MSAAMRLTLDGPVMRSGAVANLTELGIHSQRYAGWLRRCVERPAEAPSRAPNVHESGRRGAPAVVFVNGWTASGLMWPQVLIDGLARSFHVLRIDNRGTGWSRGMRRPFTIGDLADDVRGVIDHYQLARPVIVGLSMGGMITQELAMRAPQRLGHVVLLATRPPAPAHTLGPQFITAALMAPPQPNERFRDFMARTWGTVTGPGFAERNPDMVAEIVTSVVTRPTPRSTIIDQARAIAAWSGASRLKRVRVPTTVVHGVSDPLIPVRNAIRIAQLIPDADYHELPGVGHLLAHEDPTTVEAVIRRIAGS